MRLFLAISAVLMTTPARGMTLPELPDVRLDPIDTAAPSISGGRDTYWPMVRAEAVRLGVPPALADAVAIVETGYTPASVGTSGEIGMMQVMPATARMLGFAGDMSALFDPATNIHYGVTYLARAWAASGGDACRALMKYRAGVGEDGFSPLSIQYCRRAAAWLRGQDEAMADNVARHVPLVAKLSDQSGANVNGRPFHADLSDLAELAGIPDLQVEHEPAVAAAPAIRSWHISARGRHIQAVIDAALADSSDDHVIHVPQPE